MENTPKKRRNILLALCCLVMAVAGLTGLAGVGALHFLVLAPSHAYNVINEEPWRSVNARTLSFLSPRDFTKAESSLKYAFASKQYQDSPVPGFLLASLYQMTNRNEEAIQYYDKTLQVVAKYQPTWYGDILYRSFLDDSHSQLAVLYYQQQQSKKAEAELAQVSSLAIQENAGLLQALQGTLESPDRADAHFLLGVELRHELKLPEARHEFEQAIALSTDPTLRLEAQNYLKMKMPRTNKSIAPLALYYSKAGDVYHEDGQDLALAANFYEHAIEADPDFEWPYYHLGMIYHELKDETKTIEYAQKALKLNPNFFLPYLALGDVALNQENYPQAVEHYNKALALGSQLSDEEDTTIVANIENQLGYAFEQMRNQTAALSHYSKAMEISAESSEDYQYAEGSIERIHVDMRKHLSVVPKK